MRTARDVGAVLFGRARRLILGWLLGHPDQEFFLRQIARQTGLSPGSVQRELVDLVGAGLVARRRDGRQVYFRADRQSPVFEELRSLFAKTSGLAEVLRDALSPVADRIVVAFVYGSAARGELRNDSDIDLAVVGELTFGDVADLLTEPQRILGRDINPTVYTPAEFAARVKGRGHFVTSVLKTVLIFVIGGRDELEAVGTGEQVGGSAHDFEGGNRQPPRRRRSQPAGQRRDRHQR